MSEGDSLLVVVHDAREHVVVVLGRDAPKGIPLRVLIFLLLVFLLQLQLLVAQVFPQSEVLLDVEVAVRALLAQEVLVVGLVYVGDGGYASAYPNNAQGVFILDGVAVVLVVFSSSDLRDALVVSDDHVATEALGKPIHIPHSSLLGILIFFFINLQGNVLLIYLLVYAGQPTDVLLTQVLSLKQQFLPLKVLNLLKLVLLVSRA